MSATGRIPEVMRTGNAGPTTSCDVTRCRVLPVFTASLMKFCPVGLVVTVVYLSSGHLSMTSSLPGELSINVIRRTVVSNLTAWTSAETTCLHWVPYFRGDRGTHPLTFCIKVTYIIWIAIVSPNCVDIPTWTALTRYTLVLDCWNFTYLLTYLLNSLCNLFAFSGYFDIKSFLLIFNYHT